MFQRMSSIFSKQNWFLMTRQRKMKSLGNSYRASRSNLNRFKPRETKLDQHQEVSGSWQEQSLLWQLEQQHSSTGQEDENGK